MNPDETYTQGHLSAYFNLLPRAMQNRLGHNARVKWLDRHFGGLDTVQSGSRHIAALPLAYRMEMPHQTSFIEMMMGKRLIITPQVIEATSDSLKECIGLLHKNLVEILKEQGSINIYRPKIGQDLSILVTGQDYYCIHQDDPEHDHANTDLIDFYFVEVSPLTQRVCKMDFKENHMHLLDQKLAL